MTDIFKYDHFDRTVVVMDFAGYKALPHGATLIDCKGTIVRISNKEKHADVWHDHWYSEDGTLNAGQYVIADESDIEINGPFILLNPDILGRLKAVPKSEPKFNAGDRVKVVSTDATSAKYGHTSRMARVGETFAVGSVHDIPGGFMVNDASDYSWVEGDLEIAPPEPLKVGDVVRSTEGLESLPSASVIAVPGTTASGYKWFKRSDGWGSIHGNVMPSQLIRKDMVVAYIPKSVQV